jgi:hypothetical protein
MVRRYASGLDAIYTYSSLLGLWLSLVSAFCLSLTVTGIPFNGFWRRGTLIGLLREHGEVDFIVVGTTELDFKTDRL